MIRGYRADINPELSGFRTSAYVTLNLRQGHWRQIAERFQSLPDIVHIAVVGGEFEAVLSRFVPAINADLRRLVLEEIPGIEGVLNTRTLLVFDEPPTTPAVPFAT